MADYRVYEMRPTERFCVVIGLVGILCVCGYLFYASIFFVALLPFIKGPAIKAYCRYRAERRRNQLLLQFRDFLYSLSASFATGRHLCEALEEAARNLGDIYGGSLMENEIQTMIRSIRETGQSEPRTLETFALYSGLADAESFAEVYGTCRKTGGNLVSAVNKAAAVIGEKISIEQEIRTMVSQKKLEGRIIMAMPVILIVFLQTSSPDYLSVMYHTAAGRLLMTGALAAMSAAAIIIERITRIEI